MKQLLFRGEDYGLSYAVNVGGWIEWKDSDKQTLDALYRK